MPGLFLKGSTPWNKGKRLSKAQSGGRTKIFFDIDKCRTLHDAGMSLYKIAVIMQVSSNTIARRLDEKGYKRRTRQESIQLFQKTKSYSEKISKATTERWHRPEYKDKMRKIFKNESEDVKLDRIKRSRAAQSGNKINKLELKLQEILKHYNFIYVGNGKFFVDRFNPDFIDIKNKLIIEAFGDYWHNLPKYYDLDRRRLQSYHDNGFKTLIVWEHELKNLSVLSDKIKEFTSCQV